MYIARTLNNAPESINSCDLRKKKKKRKRKGKREKRGKRKDRRTKEIVANGFSRIIEHTRGDKIRGHGNQDQGDQDNEILVRSR